MMYVIEEVRTKLKGEGFAWLNQLKIVSKEKAVKMKGIRVLFSQFSNTEFGFSSDLAKELPFGVNLPPIERFISGVWVGVEYDLKHWCYKNDLYFNGYMPTLCESCDQPMADCTCNRCHVCNEYDWDCKCTEEEKQ